MENWAQLGYSEATSANGTPILEYLTPEILDHAPLDDVCKGKFRSVLKLVFEAMYEADMEEFVDKCLKWRELSQTFYMACGIEGDLWDSMPNDSSSLVLQGMPDLTKLMDRLSVDTPAFANRVGSFIDAGTEVAVGEQELTTHSEPVSDEEAEFFKRVDEGMRMSNDQVFAMVDEQLSILNLDKVPEAIDCEIGALSLNT